ncbi:MAG: hypothetical protein LIP12_15200 [Clostridiales bacterium]|nr:hypothetical protein [Clostridiales bacterium]
MFDGDIQFFSELRLRKTVFVPELRDAAANIGIQIIHWQFSPLPAVYKLQPINKTP